MSKIMWLINWVALAAVLYSHLAGCEIVPGLRVIGISSICPDGTANEAFASYVIAGLVITAYLRQK